MGPTHTDEVTTRQTMAILKYKSNTEGSQSWSKIWGSLNEAGLLFEIWSVQLLRIRVMPQTGVRVHGIISLNVMGKTYYCGVGTVLRVRIILRIRRKKGKNILLDLSELSRRSRKGTEEKDTWVRRESAHKGHNGKVALHALITTFSSSFCFFFPTTTFSRPSTTTKKEERER